MSKILVTGGCGYIGSHTAVDLIERGFEVIIADDNSSSERDVLRSLQKITGKNIKSYTVDLCDLAATARIFKENHDIVGVVHLAAYKSIPDSLSNPLAYFNNNLVSLLNVMCCAQQFGVCHFIFSSSCAVYGNPELPMVTELSPLKPAESPYGCTKQMGEQMLKMTAAADYKKCVILRYFNPAGAHPSALIGEAPDAPNLISTITQTAAGKRRSLTVHGVDYNTRDGSCVRDFVHVCDIARAHTLAVEYLTRDNRASMCDVFNLGSGSGVTVLEAINSFEKTNGVKLRCAVGERRVGDVASIFANNDLAKSRLGWSPQYNLDDIMRTSWNRELHKNAQP